MKKGVFFIFLLLALFPIVSAEILFSQPDESYSIGDLLKTEITLKPSTNSNGYLVVKLVCDNSLQEIYKNSFTIVADEEKRISIESELNRNVIGNLKGTCYLEASYSSEEGESQEFEISDHIDISLNLDGKVYEPGSTIFVKGKAERVDGTLVKGFVEVKFGDQNVKSSGIVSNGDFSFNFTIPSTASPGEHFIRTRVYELDSSGSLGNEGITNESIRVKEVPSRIEVELESDSVTPGEEISFNVKIFDQAENPISRTISVKVYDSNNKKIYEEVIETGSKVGFSTQKNSSSGYWRIESSFENLVSKKLFYVDELESADFGLVDDRFVITNTGNVIYQKPVEVKIGEETKIIEPRIEIGQSKEYRLIAPDSEYEIAFVSEEKEGSLGTTFLTGRAISVDEIGSGLFNSKITIIVILFLVLAGIVIIVNNFMRKKSKEFIAKHPTPLKLAKIKPAVMSGTKEKASVVALRVKNHEEAKDKIIELMNYAKSSGAKAYVDGDYRIAVFAPALTKQQDNEISAMRLASYFEKNILDHNRKFKNKIDFGIGVSSGEFIVEVVGDEIKLTSSGGAINAVKKIASSVNSKIAVSQSIKIKLGGALKTNKIQDHYEVSDFSERDKHKAFIKDFLDKSQKKN